MQRRNAFHERAVMERCPVCRARTKEERPDCYRCGADLSTLRRLMNEAEALERKAVRLLAENDLQGAETACKEALRLRKTPFGCALLGFIDHSRLKGEQSAVATESMVIRRRSVRGFFRALFSARGMT